MLGVEIALFLPSPKQCSLKHQAGRKHRAKYAVYCPGGTTRRDSVFFAKLVGCLYNRLTFQNDRCDFMAALICSRDLLQASAVLVLHCNIFTSICMKIGSPVPSTFDLCCAESLQVVWASSPCALTQSPLSGPASTGAELKAMKDRLLSAHLVFHSSTSRRSCTISAGTAAFQTLHAWQSDSKLFGNTHQQTQLIVHAEESARTRVRH